MTLREFENRILVCGETLAAAARLQRDLRAALEALGSKLAAELEVR